MTPASRGDKGGSKCPMGEEAKSRGGWEGTQRSQLQKDSPDTDASVKTVLSM